MTRKNYFHKHQAIQNIDIFSIPSKYPWLRLDEIDSNKYWIYWAEIPPQIFILLDAKNAPDASAVNIGVIEQTHTQSTF